MINVLFGVQQKGPTINVEMLAVSGNVGDSVGGGSLYSSCAPTPPTLPTLKVEHRHHRSPQGLDRLIGRWLRASVGFFWLLNVGSVGGVARWVCHGV